MATNNLLTRMMNRSIATFFCLPILFLMLSATNVLASCFDGNWEWQYLETDSNKLPPAYKDYKLVDLPPKYYLSLNLKIDGKTVNGIANSVSNFGSRLDAEVKVAGNVVSPAIAKVNIKSNHGGKLEATLSCEGEELVWNVDRMWGSHAFPGKATLNRK